MLLIFKDSQSIVVSFFLSSFFSVCFVAIVFFVLIIFVRLMAWSRGYGMCWRKTWTKKKKIKRIGSVGFWLGEKTNKNDVSLYIINVIDNEFRLGACFTSRNIDLNLLHPFIVLFCICKCRKFWWIAQWFTFW